MSKKSGLYKVVADEEKNNEKPIYRSPGGFGARHEQVLILFLALSVAYIVRAHLSVSLVAMIGAPRTVQVPCNQSVEGTTRLVGDGSYMNENTPVNDSVICYGEEEEEVVEGWTVYRTYKWNKSTQEMIAFSFFLGYTSMQIPMGILAQRFGGKIPICFALFVNGILSIVTPWAAVLGGWVAVSVCRLIQGMTQAAFYPGIHATLGKWAPYSERGRLSTYVYTGSAFGTVFAFQFSGVLAGNQVFGWPANFWLSGILNLICFGILAHFGAASPSEHRSISDEEMTYISNSGGADPSLKKRKTPWMHMLKSKPLWGLYATHAGSTVMYLFILTEIPLYMNRILNVDIKMNGLYSSLPYISLYVCTLVFGFLSDLCIKKGYLKIVNVRRVANTIGMPLCGCFLLWFSFVSRPALAVPVLMVSLGLHSGVHVGFHINHIDLAPNFAGPMMALGNSAANLCGLLVPVLVSNILKDDVANPWKWQILFMIITAISIVSNAIFVVCAKGEVQQWNEYDVDTLNECQIAGKNAENKDRSKVTDKSESVKL